MEYQFRTLAAWPQIKTKSRRSRSTFRASWSNTVEKLKSELEHLNARNVVIQASVSTSDIRRDGMLRANASVGFPGVILSFETKNGAMSFPCDSCEFWQHNVRSIALGLAALRSVDRYGITQNGEQYRGWDRLPDPSSPSGPQIPRNSHEAIDLIKKCLDAEHGSYSRRQIVEAAQKELRKQHPDHGGDARLFRALNEAIQLLTKAG